MDITNLGSNTPEDAVEVKVAVAPGDVIILGTDGVFDNLFAWEIEEVLEEKEFMDLHSLGVYIASLAVYNSFDEFRETPFSVASTETGEPCTGGKFDDITVVIARIVDVK
ncbi:probable protein phosphatase 2C 55 [Humulus lupulus]|uniref:probable protein phosphatase 2C 55 n=1 Tax=Humulus lupulus TaxID=3486 RepID=UPI002B400A05|nr:probable protein phosphatase 2C 55 [Humulus lupulus]